MKREEKFQYTEHDRQTVGTCRCNNRQPATTATATTTTNKQQHGRGGGATITDYPRGCMPVCYHASYEALQFPSVVGVEES